MKTKQVLIAQNGNQQEAIAEAFSIKPQLALVFGNVEMMEKPELRDSLKKLAPANCTLIGCSTAGEISNKGVSDHSLVLTAVNFESTNVQVARTKVPAMEKSAEAGADLARKLKQPELKAVIVFSKGLEINGSALVKGLQQELGPDVLITGGLAGDDVRFQKTLTLVNGEACGDEVVAIGLSGASTRVLSGTNGGWQPFGPVRRVTRAEGNVLFELDNRPALSIYKEYLGEHAKNLPASALLFPLAILKNDRDSSGLIRTILGVDEKQQSLTFAGDIPNNGIVRLMYAPDDAIIDGARGAAENIFAPASGGLAILISCVGRKLVLGQDVDEEVEAVREVLGEGATFTGFYSYGEICPEEKGGACHLHNQTMTITYISEGKKAA